MPGRTIEQLPTGKTTEPTKLGTEMAQNIKQGEYGTWLLPIKSLHLNLNLNLNLNLTSLHFVNKYEFENMLCKCLALELFCQPLPVVAYLALSSCNLISIFTMFVSLILLHWFSLSVESLTGATGAKSSLPHNAMVRFWCP